METKATAIVLFADRLEGWEVNGKSGIKAYLRTMTEKHYGVLFEYGFILCFCCGGYVDPEDYIIIEYCDWDKVDETLLKNY